MATPLYKMNKQQLLAKCKELYAEKEEWKDIFSYKIQKLEESYKYGTLGENGVHIMLNKQGDKYYCHNTAMEIEKLLAKCKDLEEKLEFIKKVKEDYFKTIKWKNDMIVDLEEENKKLKEENSHIMEEYDKYRQAYILLTNLKDQINTYTGEDTNCPIT